MHVCEASDTLTIPSADGNNNNTIIPQKYVLSGYVTSRTNHHFICFNRQVVDISIPTWWLMRVLWCCLRWVSWGPRRTWPPHPPVPRPDWLSPRQRQTAAVNTNSWQTSMKKIQILNQPAFRFGYTFCFKVESI